MPGNRKATQPAWTFHFPAGPHNSRGPTTNIEFQNRAHPRHNQRLGSSFQEKLNDIPHKTQREQPSQKGDPDNGIEVVFFEGFEFFEFFVLLTLGEFLETGQ